MNLEIGQRLEKKLTFTQAEFDQFARLSGDDNPIHVDTQYAAKTVFGRPVAHGMFLFSHICAGLFELCPDLPLQQQKMMFRAPTFTQEVNQLQLDVTAVSNQFAKVQTAFTRPDGDYGLIGEATLDFREGVVEPCTPASPAAFKGLQAGQVAQLSRQFSSAEIDEFCTLIGDQNPLWQTAVPYGLLGGMISDLLGTKLPGRGTNWLKQQYLFAGQAHIGDQLTAVVRIKRIRPEKELVTLGTSIFDSDGEKVVAGKALVLIKELISSEVSMR